MPQSLKLQLISGKITIRKYQICLLIYICIKTNLRKDFLVRILNADCSNKKMFVYEKAKFAIQVGLYSESQDSVFLALAESVS